VVDLDREKFFDRVNHDKLMSRVKERITDRRVLQLMDRYLKAGALTGDGFEATTEGTPQGGPLSPLFAHLLLDGFDKELVLRTAIPAPVWRRVSPSFQADALWRILAQDLRNGHLERRGHRFVRYADDSNIYGKSARAGQRVLASVSRFLEQRLKLTVNAAKSAVDRPWRRMFLGFTFTGRRPHRRPVSAKALKALKQEVRQRTGRTRGIPLRRLVHDLRQYLEGWYAYFRLDVHFVSSVPVGAGLVPAQPRATTRVAPT
jgi:RNA-directed DNA polymerase